uniref:Uncharacterized protein n=1 Tax=viral metagenome TaxID=1070528 RepID=A0A6C0BNL4_9ZZZZ
MTISIFDINLKNDTKTVINKLILRQINILFKIKIIHYKNV